MSEQPACHREASPAQQRWRNLRTAASATLHCLSGCVIGEVAGLSIGVSLGLAPWATIALATVLAYCSGFLLGLLPVMRNHQVSLGVALRMIWLGEVLSIGVMELAMNAADYYMGGMQAPGIWHSQFWLAIAVAVPCGYLAALPGNYWLLQRGLKHCH